MTNLALTRTPTETCIYIFFISLFQVLSLCWSLLGLLTLLFQLKFESWESNPIPSMSSQIVRSASRAARSLLSASKNSRFYSGKSFFFLVFTSFVHLNRLIHNALIDLWEMIRRYYSFSIFIISSKENVESCVYYYWKIDHIYR